MPLLLQVASGGASMPSCSAAIMTRRTARAFGTTFTSNDLCSAHLLGRKKWPMHDCFYNPAGSHFYTTNAFDACFGKAVRIYREHSAFCSDSPNRPDFPNTVLRAGESVQEIISYRLSIR